MGQTLCVYCHHYMFCAANCMSDLQIAPLTLQFLVVSWRYESVFNQWKNIFMLYRCRTVKQILVNLHRKINHI